MTKILRVIPLGGLGEVGKNMLALEYQNDIIVIDAGVMFPEEDMPGVDLVIPNIDYLLERKHKVRAILITHGHEDHTGALPFVLPRLPVPVYAPRLAHGLIQVKLREYRRLRDAKLHQVEPGRPLRLGAFRVEFFRVCHSIPDAMGLAIETPLGLVIHTGDFKIDHTPVDGKATDFTKLAGLAAKKVFLLFSDSTYAERPGYTLSEQVVGESLDHLIGQAPGRVMLATFASLVSRVQQVMNAAAKHDRKVALVGRSMVDNMTMAIKMGYLTPPPGVLRPWNEIKHLPPSQIAVVTTGSQGEPTSALVRIANQDHRDVKAHPGDTIIISASPIPGNETLISRTIDNLYRQGARVLYSGNAQVHVHGHASQEELKMMLRVTQPRYFVPVHGEYRHLVAHGSLAQAMGVLKENIFILENGHILELTERQGRVSQRIPCGHVFVDGQHLEDMSSTVFRDRKRLSGDGVVLVVLPISKVIGRLLMEPEIVSSGFIDIERQDDLLRRASQVVTQALEDNSGVPLEPGEANTRVEEVLGKFLYNETGRHPLIVPVTLRV